MEKETVYFWRTEEAGCPVTNFSMLPALSVYYCRLSAAYSKLPHAFAIVPQWFHKFGIFFSHACGMALRMPMSACQSIAVVQPETTAGDGWNHWCDTILARHSWFPVSWQLRFWVKSSKMIGWIFMKFGTHVHVPIRMKSNHFDSSSGAIIQSRFVLYFVTCRNDIHISCTMSSSKMLAC